MLPDPRTPSEADGQGAWARPVPSRLAEGIVALALLASALVSFTLTAVLAANLFQPHAESEAHRSWLERRALDPTQRFLERVEARYRTTLAWSFRNRFAIFAGALAVILVGLSLYPRTGSEMSSMKAVTSMAQANSGILCMVMPGARILKIVVMKLMAPRMDDAPER